ncbi:hypothetical protein A2U01_0104695, partial [Trifolium medium]|nr:hypothetical protein [Trifolium medium]
MSLSIAWRQVAMASQEETSQLATAGDLKNGARRHLATDTQNRVF